MDTRHALSRLESRLYGILVVFAVLGLLFAACILSVGVYLAGVIALAAAAVAITVHAIRSRFTSKPPS